MVVAEAIYSYLVARLLNSSWRLQAPGSRLQEREHERDARWVPFGIELAALSRLLSLPGAWSLEPGAWKSLLNHLRDDPGADGAATFTDREPHLLLETDGRDELDRHRDVVARHDHLRPL